MRSLFVPAMLVLAGFALIAEPMRAACTGTPTIYLPSKCTQAYVSPAIPSPGMCMKLANGTCMSVLCGGVTWENAVAGKCNSAPIDEYGAPRCEADFATTLLTINKFSVGCQLVATKCKCVMTATGESANIEVCNCRQLTPTP